MEMWQERSILFVQERSQSSHRFPYGYLVMSSPQLKFMWYVHEEFDHFGVSWTYNLLHA
jgi:hypothetical protein